MSLAPGRQAIADRLHVDVPTLDAVLATWGPGKFDAEVLHDGRALRPDGGSAATLIPPAFGLAGVNLHTWTGFGSVPYWNAYVAGLKKTTLYQVADAMRKEKTEADVRATAAASTSSERSRRPSSSKR